MSFAALRILSQERVQQDAAVASARRLWRAQRTGKIRSRQLPQRHHGAEHAALDQRTP